MRKFKEIINIGSFMRLLFLFLLILPLTAKASFLFQYGLNYSSEKDDSSSGEFEESRTFHKAFLAASVDSKKTLFFGWNINSWNSKLSQGSAAESTYSMLEMGPRLQWFLNENYNWYLSAEWNPYAKGDRDKSAVNREISGSSLGFGLGYRFRISRYMGFGAGIHYHSLSVKEEKINSTENTVSDGVTNLMPMLELSILTK
jgi:outer membrane protein assembly factor BamA